MEGYLDEFESMKVKELKDYLKRHDQLLSGKKEELVRRAKGTFQLLLQKNVDGADEAENNVESPADETAEIHENQTFFKLKGWEAVDSVSCDDWPDVTDKELYNYLVYTCHKSVDAKRKKARRQLKAHIFYDDGHVHSISYHPVADDSDQCYVKCLVIPSFAASDKTKYPDRSVWVRASKVTGQISSAYCSCTAGLEGSCNHVAALLYAMVDITANKSTGLDASTSNACKWKQPRKRRLSPKKSHLLYKHCKADNSEPPKSGVNIASFAEKLAKCAPRAGWLVNFTAPEAPLHQDPPTEKKLPSIPPPEYMFADNVDISADTCKHVFVSYVKKLVTTCSAEDRLQTELMTRDQAKSKDWFIMREGRLTSSNFGDVCKRKEQTKPDNLLKKVMGYRQLKDNEHLKWGREHEPAARRTYVNAMKSTHPGIQVRKAGLILDETLPFLATSPDGMVMCPHCSPTQGVLEIKCPSALKDKTPEEACQDKQFFCELVDGRVTLKRHHDYYFQVQGQMGVSQKQWCDFFVWTLKGYTVERITFDKDLWADMLEKLQHFYVGAVVPEIFTDRVKRGRSLLF